MRKTNNYACPLGCRSLAPYVEWTDPGIGAEIKCRDGKIRRFTLTFYVDASKRYYTVVFVEKTLERDKALIALIGSTVEEEVPADFGVLDVREHVHRFM